MRGYDNEVLFIVLAKYCNLFAGWFTPPKEDG